MEKIYHWIGLVIFWLSAGTGTLLLTGYIIKLILNELGKQFTVLWKIVEFIYYYSDWKEWIKDKKRSDNKPTLDLCELEQRLNESLDQENSESLKKWIESQRQ